mgnify:CR=1 FL=1
MAIRSLITSGISSAAGRAVPVFVDDAARDAAYPDPPEGTVAYVDGALQIHTSGVWTAVGGGGTVQVVTSPAPPTDPQVNVIWIDTSGV